MKVRNIELEIIQVDMAEISADVVIDSTNTPLIMGDDVKTNEHVVRQGCAQALSRAQDLQAESVALSAFGGEGFPVVASAKIMAQEILRFATFEKSHVKKIILCLSEEDMYQTFQQTVIGYVTHIQDDLGNGPYVTVDAVIELDEGIVLIERSNPPYGWALPGGFVDCGESLETAVVREVQEETNLAFEDIRQMHTYSTPERDPRFHTVSTVFVGKGQGTPHFGDDAKGLKIVRYEELLDGSYAFDHKGVIRDYLAGKQKGAI